MFSPQILEKIPLKLEKIFSELELDIMLDIVRRIKETGQITRTADWQINRLHYLGASKRVIKKYIQDTLKLSKKEINHIYKDVIRAGYAEDETLYKVTGKPFIKYKDNTELQQIVDGVKRQTNNQLYNITQSTGFIKKDKGKTIFTPLTQYYQDTLDRNVSGILNGSFDYNTAIRNTVDEMTKSGLRTVDYASGKSYRIESAASMSLMTGVNQVTSKISDENMKKLDTDYAEVSAHGTARPSHQVWQGKVWTRKQLEEVCGLGKADGLCGIHCRHTYWPFIPGVSIRAYTDEELSQMAKEENTPRKYGDKEYTAYEATQEQRKMERLMRKQRQDIKLLKEGEANEDDITIAQAKYRITSNEYAKFSKAMDIPEQRERITADGLKGNFSGGKEAEAMTKILQNETTYTDITSNYQEKKDYEIEQQEYVIDNNSVKYEVDGTRVVLNPTEREQQVGNMLGEIFGGKVSVIPRVNEPPNIKTPDYIVNEESFDLKEIVGVGKYVIQGNLKGKQLQANNFVIDISKSKITVEEAISQIDKIFKSKHYYWIDKILLIQDDELLRIYKRK